MIELSTLTPRDIGRPVVYHPTDEHGTITSWNHEFIYVRYGTNPQGNATSPADLDWAEASIENPFPGPFARRIVHRMRCPDGTEEVRLECGHEVTRIIPLPDAQRYSPCAECVNEYVDQHRTGATHA